MTTREKAIKNCSICAPKSNKREPMETIAFEITSRQGFAPRPKKDENGLYPCPLGKRMILEKASGEWWVDCTYSGCGCSVFSNKRRCAVVRAANKWVSVWWGKEEK
jgi:hypothetical protein